MQADNTVISYATPRIDAKPANLPLANTCMWTGIAAPVVGLSILFCYRLTAWEFLPPTGGIWLMVGGACAGLAGLFGLIGYFGTNRGAQNALPAKRRFLIGLMSGIVAVPVAFMCVVLGGKWAESPHFRLRVTNNAQRPVDRVTVHFDSGDVVLGPIAPGESDRTWLMWRGHSGGPLYITVQIGDKSRRRMDRVDCTRENLQGPYYDLQVEESELPTP